MLICFCIIWGRFPATREELSTCDRDQTARKGGNSYSLSLYRKVCRPLTKWSPPPFHLLLILRGRECNPGTFKGTGGAEAKDGRVKTHHIVLLTQLPQSLLRTEV